MATMLRLALGLQLIHLLLSMVWNVAGVWLIAQGQRAPGPTASLLAVPLMLLLGAAMFFGLRRRRWLYMVASLLAGLGALAAVVQAFSADPALWPSDFWRATGTALNCLGVVGAVLGLGAIATSSASARRSAVQ
jgi:hypothetical protein